MQTEKQQTSNLEKRKYNREFIDNNLNVFNWWSTENFNLSRLKRVNRIFLLHFPLCPLSVVSKLNTERRTFIFVTLSIPCVTIRHWYSQGFKKMVGMGYITFSYRQHENQNFLIISLVWERGKMRHCNDWVNHQNFSQKYYAGTIQNLLE